MEKLNGWFSTYEVWALVPVGESNATVFRKEVIVRENPIQATEYIKYKYPHATRVGAKLVAKGDDVYRGYNIDRYLTV